MTDKVIVALECYDQSLARRAQSWLERALQELFAPLFIVVDEGQQPALFTAEDETVKALVDDLQTQLTLEQSLVDEVAAHLTAARLHFALSVTGELANFGSILVTGQFILPAVQILNRVPGHLTEEENGFIHRFRHLRAKAMKRQPDLVILLASEVLPPKQRQLVAAVANDPAFGYDLQFIEPSTLLQTENGKDPVESVLNALVRKLHRNHRPNSRW